MKKTRKRGGYLIPLVTGAIGATTGLYKTYKDVQHSRKLLEENIRHNQELEKILREKNTVNLKTGSGYKKKRKCRRRKISFL